jgi:hypothetical protein
MRVIANDFDGFFERKPPPEKCRQIPEGKGRRRTGRWNAFDDWEDSEGWKGETGCKQGKGETVFVGCDFCEEQNWRGKE